MKEKLIDDSRAITQSEFAENIFNRWDRDIRNDYGETRFNAKNRGEILMQLVEAFSIAGINYNTALGFEKKVVNTIVTKKGMNGAGKYKNWTKVVVAEYKKFLLEVYESQNLEIKVEPDNENDEPELVAVTGSNHLKEVYVPAAFDTAPTYGDHMHLDKNQLISAWAKYRFGSFYNAQLDLLAHRVGSELNVLFQKEVLFSDWLTNGNNVPKWADGYV